MHYGNTVGEERQRLVRRSNEARASSVIGIDATSMNVACECGVEGCDDELTVSRTVYRRVRRQPRWFLVRDGHQQPDAQRVVHLPDACVIVESGSG